MEDKQNKIVGGIRKAYEPKNKSEQKLEELVALNRKVYRPAEIFTYIFGTVGALVLGVGMCLAMKVIGASLSFAMPMGIAIGCLGILMMVVNYPIYKAILKARKEKYAQKIISLSDELLNN